MEVPSDVNEKACKDLREKMNIEVSNDRTFLILLAIHQDPTKNFNTRIQCRKGMPISGYVYDAQQQFYYIECHDYVPLGYIPVSIFVTMPGVGNWRQRMPLPEAAIRRYLSPTQKEDLRKFKLTYRNGQFDVHFMQVIDCC